MKVPLSSIAGIWASRLSRPFDSALRAGCMYIAVFSIGNISHRPSPDPSIHEAWSGDYLDPT